MMKNIEKSQAKSPYYAASLPLYKRDFIRFKIILGSHRDEWVLGRDGPPWALGMGEPWAGMGPRYEWALGMDGPSIGPGHGWATMGPRDE